MNVKKLLVILVGLLALTGGVHASATKSVMGQVGGELEKLVEKGWIVTTTRDVFNFMTKVYDNLPEFILANPSATTLKSIQGRIVSFLYPVFVLATVTTAAYLLLFSESPRGRVKAKGILIRLLFALILISLSSQLTELLLAFSGSLTKAVLNLASLSTAVSATKTGAEMLFWLFADLTMIHRTGGIDLLLLWETFLLIFNFALATRYLLVVFWCTLLPASLFLYTLPPTKKIGKKFLHQTFLWTFVQVGWAFAVVLISASATTIYEAMPEYSSDMVGIGCLMLMIGTPMALLGLMDWLSMGVEVIEIVNAAPLSIGALTIDEMKVERAVINEEPAMDGV